MVAAALVVAAAVREEEAANITGSKGTDSQR